MFRKINVLLRILKNLDIIFRYPRYFKISYTYLIEFRRGGGEGGKL